VLYHQKTKTPKANKEQTNQHQQLTNEDWVVPFLNFLLLL